MNVRSPPELRTWSVRAEPAPRVRKSRLPAPSTQHFSKVQRDQHKLTSAQTTPPAGSSFREGQAAHFVAYYQKPKNSPRRVHLMGVGQAGIVALHAAALRPELFASVTLRNTPHEWASTVKRPIPAGLLEGTIHGALKVYDLPNLVQLIGMERVRFEN